MTNPPESLLQQLQDYGQEHLLQWFGELDHEQREQLLHQINSFDLNSIRQVWQSSRATPEPDDAESDSRIAVAKPPQTVVREPETGEERDQRAADVAAGAQLLADGKIAVVTVAGGQGTRLEFDHAKGMFPIGPVTGSSLFQIFAEQIQARINRHGGQIPWLIMTSDATHAETVKYFEENEYFGLNKKGVSFFQQGSMPAVDLETGKILMSDKSGLCLSPDGHGGLVTALKSSGLLKELADNNIEHIFYHQIDNPTVIICDPALIGVHARLKSQLTTNVVRKLSPTEKMGALADVNDRIEIIEYTELTPEQAASKDDDGTWIFWAGNTGIHVFARSFFEELTTDGCQLNWHLAKKKVPHIDEQGQPVTPTQPNAGKFERFIFDALPLAKHALIVEGSRTREFNPVKNKDGDDSPATARAAITQIGRDWLHDAGIDIPEDSVVEISPLTALDANELATKLGTGEISVTDLVH